MVNIKTPIILLSLILVFFLGFYFKDFITNNPAVKNIPWSQKTCEYNNITYNSGDGFMDKEGCNQCSCTNGEVACTLMACENDVVGRDTPVENNTK